MKKKPSKDNNKSSINKKIYKPGNWSQYNQALINRGDITLWIPENVLSWWSGKGRYTYSAEAIECALTLRAVNNQPLRQTVGLLKSVFKLAE